MGMDVLRSGNAVGIMLAGGEADHMVLSLACKATMMYWFPLRACGWKRPVSSRKIMLIGIVMKSSVCLIGRAPPMLEFLSIWWILCVAVVGPYGPVWWRLH